MTRRNPAGRGVARLLADFGPDLPRRPPQQVRAGQQKLFPRVVSRRGRMATGAGWAAATAPLSVWRMTSDRHRCSGR